MTPVLHMRKTREVHHALHISAGRGGVNIQAYALPEPVSRTAGFGSEGQEEQLALQPAPCRRTVTGFGPLSPNPKACRARSGS